ncbi:MAG: DedA family protein [Firmicutes bacterium]|nr:DedA family protein [Bacillota bacterium]
MSPSQLLQHYGYIGVVIALILEFLLIPFPAETILVVSGVMWHKGLFHLIPLLIVATLGSWGGSLLGYSLGRLLGRPVIVRYGRYVKLDEKNLLKAETAFRQYSVLILGIGRFIAGIRVLIAYVAGINKMSIGLYGVITLVSAAIWATAFILLGATIGTEWHVVSMWILMHKFLSGLFLVILLAVLFFWLRRKRLAKQRERGEHAS